jgi:preprotein translocase subunit Sss1
VNKLKGWSLIFPSDKHIFQSNRNPTQQALKAVGIAVVGIAAVGIAGFGIAIVGIAAMDL